MGTPLLLLVTAIYLMVAGTYYANGRYGLCLTFIAYSLANIGLIWDLHK